jgi:EAL domain-containing protein (putative c-di-GMP-specific phosphodiesterase class I)
MGGDEFIMLLSSSSNEIFEIKSTVQLILMVINKTIIIRGKAFNITACIGCSCFPDDSKLASTLFKKADIAVRFAKKKSKNSFEFCTPELTNLFNEKIMLEKELKLTINDNKLFLHFQPKLSLNSKAIDSVEALLRWTHPLLGVIAPSQFIPIAEETGLIIPLTHLVIRQCCQQIKIWEEQNITLKVAINISGKNLEDPEFVTKLLYCIQEFDVNPKLIEIEITETSLMQEATNIQTLLNNLKSMGMTISIDDFGTGYSSLSYLRRFTIDNLKIDQSFTRDLLSDINAESIIIGIIAIAHSLQLNVIAEGVETLEQLQRLNELGCNEIQGFYFSKPLPADELVSFLKVHKYKP